MHWMSVWLILLYIYICQPNAILGQGSCKKEIGEKGERGPRGPPGRPGSVIGYRGYPGHTGHVGLAGVDGFPGDKGAKGPRGISGLPGKRGNRGRHGQKGSKGQKGEKGNMGRQGIWGKKGEKGDHGMDGPRGGVGPRGRPGRPGRCTSLNEKNKQAVAFYGFSDATRGSNEPCGMVNNENHNRCQAMNSTGTFGNTQKVKFVHILVNEGGGFDEELDIFKVHKTGLYQLSMSSIADGNCTLPLVMYKNGDIIMTTDVRKGKAKIKEELISEKQVVSQAEQRRNKRKITNRLGQRRKAKRRQIRKGAKNKGPGKKMRKHRKQSTKKQVPEKMLKDDIAKYCHDSDCFKIISSGKETFKKDMLKEAKEKSSEWPIGCPGAQATNLILLSLHRGDSISVRINQPHTQANHQTYSPSRVYFSSHIIAPL